MRNIHIDKMEADAELAEVYGGTAASSRLRSALRERSVVVRHAKAWNMDATQLLARIDACIEAWRRALVRHNAQPEKMLEYDTATGEPKRGAP